MDTVRYVFGLFLVIGLPPGITWWYVVHPAVGFWRRLGVRVTMMAMTVFMTASLGVLFWKRTVVMGTDLGFSPWVFALGVVLTLAGFRIALVRRKYLTKRILTGVPELEADPDKQGELLEGGPYALVRHPRYVEIWFVSFGYAAISNWTGAWVVALLSIPALHLVVLLEERELVDRFGEAYREYAARVPRYVPSSFTSTSPPSA